LRTHDFVYPVAHQYPGDTGKFIEVFVEVENKKLKY